MRTRKWTKYVLKTPINATSLIREKVEAAVTYKLNDSDSEYVKSLKLLLMITLIFTAPIGLAWGLAYHFLDETLPGLIPGSFAVVQFLSLILYSKRPDLVREIFLVLRFAFLILPFLLFLSLGGFVLSSAVIIWSIGGLFISILIPGQKRAVSWYLGFVMLMVIGTLAHPYLRQENNLSQNQLNFFFLVNILGVSIITYGILLFFIQERSKLLEQVRIEKSKSEELLLNVLPEEVIPFLQDNDNLFVESFENVSVMFADIVGFTKLSQIMDPQTLLKKLNDVFTHFDSLLGKYKAEKIRTIGDNYMVCVGAPRRVNNHQVLITEMALDMIRFVMNSHNDISFRIGINSGPAIGGVIGRHRFHFDL